MKIVITRTLFWTVRLVAANGEVVLSSETYYSKGNARRAAIRLSEVIGVPVKGT